MLSLESRVEALEEKVREPLVWILFAIELSVVCFGTVVDFVRIYFCCRQKKPVASLRHLLLLLSLFLKKREKATENIAPRKAGL